MPRFRFRAQAALELRVREHEDTLRELARAESEQQQARGRLDLAERTLEEARRTADDAARTLTSAGDLLWYRNWIVRLDGERAACVLALDASTRAVADARRVCLAAKQRRESLERFREKALATFLDGEAAQERKLIDELATRRYATTRQAL